MIPLNALNVKDLHKNYGEFKALDGVSFSVKDGEIYGLIGPNGAGKTTALRTISTLLTIDSGEIDVYGTSVKDEPDKVRKIISYLPEDAGAYKDLTGRKYLTFMANFFADGDGAKAIVDRGIEIADLEDRIDSKVSTYSKGMMRRLLIARAIMPQPKLAILDEVTSGLDVVNAYEIRSIIKSIAGHGVSILLSSHNMFEVELLCDRVGMINKGVLVQEGTPEQLKARFNANSLEEVFVKAVGE